MRASLWILSIWCWHDRHKTFLYFIARDVVVRGCTAQVHWLCHRRLVLILSNSQMLPFFYYFSQFSLCFASLIFSLVFFFSLDFFITMIPVVVSVLVIIIIIYLLLRFIDCTGFDWCVRIILVISPLSRS